MINKNRITALETAAGRINAPSDIEYNAASERMTDSVRARIEAAIIGNETILTPQETAQQAADETLIQAYNKAHSIPEDDGAGERIMHRLDLIARRMGNES